jgi:2-dehydro-3-deoxy-D-gluconate 5-dehydrogenase
MKPLQDLLNLSGKAVIVTGGAKGIGYGISYRLAEAGAKVLIADMDEPAAKQAARELNDKGWKAEIVTVDVSSEVDVKRMINLCKELFGSVDILVNNAGIYPAMSLAEMSVDLFDKVIQVNLRSVFLTTKYVAEVMKPQGGGKIINISSIDALHPTMVGLAHYDASKHGMWGFTKNAALELAEHKIWVNAIAPGGIATPGATGASDGPATEQAVAQAQAFLARIPMQRMGQPDDIGMVALFLASDMSAYMTGEQVVVDGGALLK